MIGMDFVAFIILVVISVGVSAILHYGFKFYTAPGLSSFFSKVVAGWIGAWLGSPVLGHWFEGVNYGEVYFLPAIIGCAAILVLAIDILSIVAPKRD